MPHAFVKTQLLVSELIQKLKEETLIVEDIVIKVYKGYIHTITEDALLPCLVIEPFYKQKFYIQLCQKNLSKILLRIDPMENVNKTVGVRLSLAFLARTIAAFDPDAAIETGNLKSYFDFFSAEATQQSTALQYLRGKLGSYLRAAERRTKATQYTLSLDGKTPPFEWSEIFQNSNPVEIEIGSGKGKFILNEAETNPGKNFLAIEWSPRYLKSIKERIPSLNLNNFRLLQADARLILAEWIPIDTITKFHIYYPDPWWKKKHEKHKIFTQIFLKNLENTLIKNGVLALATDVEELLFTAKDRVRDFTRLNFIHEKIYKPGGSPPPGRSNFEIKKWQEGSQIFEASWQKSDS